MINYGFDEKTIKNWRNKGIIHKPKNGGRPSKWVGYTIEYKAKTVKHLKAKDFQVLKVRSI